jgi:hypothetical protein
MATLVFGAIGTAIAPGYGTVIGGVIGMGVDYLGGRLIARALAPGPPAPMRVRVKGADAGEEAPVYYGQYMRVPGQVIWSGRVISQEVTGESKGKTPGTVSYKYVMDIAVAFGRAPVQDIAVIYANGDKIYSNYPAADEGDQDFPVAFIVSHLWTYKAETLRVISFFVRWVDYAGYNVSAGTDYTITGPTPQNEGVMRRGAQYLTPPVSYDPSVYTVLNMIRCHIRPGIPPCDPGIDVADPAGTWTFTQASSALDWSEQYLEGPPEKHLGTEDQPTSAILSDVWTGNPSWPALPAYRSTAYAVLRNFNITKFGGQFPQFEAIVKINDSAPTVGSVIRSIAARSVTNVGVEVNTDDVEDITMSGMIVLGAVPIKDTLRQIMEFYFLDAIETFRLDEASEQVFPQIKFVKRKDVGARSVPFRDIGAAELGTSVFDRQEITVADRRTIPTSLSVDFLDLSHAYQPGSFAYSVRPGGVVSDTSTKVSFDLALSPTQAQILARTILWNSIVIHDQIKFTLPMSYLHVQPGDHVQWPLPGEDPENVYCRVNKTSRGQNGVIEVEAMIDDTRSYAQSFPMGYSSGPPPSLGSPSEPGFTLMFIFDTPAVIDTEATSFGLYIFNAITPQSEIDPATPYAVSATETRPTTIYKSIDGGLSFQVVGTQTSVGVFGFAENALGAASDIALDTFNYIDVELASSNMSLSSASAEAVSSGLRNNAVLGDEYIGFIDVEYLGGRRYRLTNLVRGRRDTIEKATLHTTAEIFVLIGVGFPLPFSPLMNSDLNRPVLLLGVPSGADPVGVADYNAIEFTPKGETLRPFIPRSRWLTRCPDQSIRLYFKWRTRYPFRLGSGVYPPRVDQTHCFSVEIYWMDPAAAGGYEFVRKTTCEFENDDEYFIDYPCCEQAEDFHNTGRILDGSYPVKLGFELYKESATLGSGRRGLIEIDGVGPLIKFF